MSPLRRWRRVRAARVRWATHVPGCPQRPAFVPLWAIGSSHGLRCVVLHPPEPCAVCGRGVRHAVSRTRYVPFFPGVGVRARNTRHGVKAIYCSLACRDARPEAQPKPRELKPSYTPADRMLQPQPCPHPAKKAFAQRVVAERYFAPLLLADPRLEVYQCRCWRFHAGHPTEVRDEVDFAPPTDLRSEYALGAIARITPPKGKP